MSNRPHTPESVQATLMELQQVVESTISASNQATTSSAKVLVNVAGAFSMADISDKLTDPTTSTRIRRFLGELLILLGLRVFIS